MDERKDFFGFNRSMIIQCMLLYIGIWGGLILNNYIFLVVAGCTLLVAALTEIETTFYHLFFLLPFTVVFKLSPDSTSLFAYLMIATGIILLFRKRRVQGVSVVLILLFVAYAIVGMGSNFTTILKMTAGLLLLCVFVETVTPEHFKNHIMAFALGILGSSWAGMLKASWNGITRYFSDIDYVFINGKLTMRFSGLNYDPNYYSIAVVIVVFLCLRLLLDKQGNRILLAGLIAIMAGFGFASYSKMFFVTILILGVFFIICRTSSPKQIATTLIGSAIVFVMFSYWAESTGYLETINRRLYEGDVSTGRFGIWENYMKYIWDSPKTFLFGDGFGSPYYHSVAPHNAYIELLFYLGIIGGMIFVLTVAYIVRSVKHVESRKLIDVALVILFLGMIMTLGVVTMNELMFYFMLLWMSMNMRKVSSI